MKLMDIYEQIENPISDPSTIVKLIDLYSTNSDSFYNRLTRATVKKHTRGEHYKKDEDMFYSMLFNTWKKNVLSMSEERYEELKEKGIYGTDFIGMKEYLKKLPNLCYKSEINKYMYQEAPKEVSNAYFKYRFDFGNDSLHVSSKRVDINPDSINDIEHRLYLNTDTFDTYKIAKILYEKLSKENIPVHFKLDQYGSRDDTIVISTSTEHLVEHLKVLEEIKKENPSLVSRIMKPPVLTGKIDGWIGYGSEPDKVTTSFNQVREKPILEAIRETIIEWISKNQNIIIKYNNEVVTFKDYLSLQVKDNLFEDLEEAYNAVDKSTNKKFGYTKKDLQSKHIQDDVYETIRKHISTDLNDMKPFKVKINNKEIKVDKNVIDKTIETIAPKIVRNDPSVIKIVKDKIIEKSRGLGIDVDKYCFDVLRREQMAKYDIEKEKEHLQKLRESLSVLGNKKEVQKV